MKPYVSPLSTALGHLQQATAWLMQNAITKPDNAGAAAPIAVFRAPDLGHTGIVPVDRVADAIKSHHFSFDTGGLSDRPQPT